MKLVVAIPTWNNPQQLEGALKSLEKTDIEEFGEVIVVDNGGSNANLGWCGGINKALSQSSSDLFCMCNDDVVFPVGDFWRRLLRHFDRSNVGGVGPISNYVSGLQHASLAHLPPLHTTHLLIGFCAVYRRSLLGDGLDDQLPGGDDLDISIRVRKSGSCLMVDRSCFLYHLGAQTGRRVFPNYWDTREHQHQTLNAIIRKHGLRQWYDCINPMGEYVELRPES